MATNRVWRLLRRPEGVGRESRRRFSKPASPVASATRCTEAEAHVRLLTADHCSARFLLPTGDQVPSKSERAPAGGNSLQPLEPHPIHI